MLFHLFCMFDDYWRINCQSHNSAGKRTVKIPYFWRSAIHGKHLEVNSPPGIPYLMIIAFLKKAKGKAEVGHQGPTPCHGAGYPLAAPPRGVVALAHHCRCPFEHFIPPQNPKTGEPSRKYFAASTRRKTIEREKLFGRKKSAREIPSRRGEIIAIVTVIELYFIGIIIIISTAITIISTAPLCSAVTSRVESCLFHRGNFLGVNYSLWLMLLSETVELRFVSRLLFTIISPLIMIHMMSCE